MLERSQLWGSQFCAGVLAISVVAVVQAQSARDYISIVGSSTVYPFATVVAEQFGKTSDFKTPKIESTGSGGGLKLFCAGVGVEHPDITNSSRRIKQSEVDMCAGNGVNEIIEIKIGYDGLSLANAKDAPGYDLSKEEIFLALAKDVPNPDGANSGKGLVPNPYTHWNQINPELPEAEIEVLGPPPTSGTRDAFVELVMDEGCEAFEAIEAMDKDAKKAACRTLREDGHFIEAGENDNLIVQKLGANPNALGIFGFSFLDTNLDKLQGVQISGVDPTFENISDGSYPVSRPLFFYVKKAHIGAIPGIEEYLAEFISDKASGEEGYLADKGMIPMPAEEHAKFKSDIENLNPLNLSGT